MRTGTVSYKLEDLKKGVIIPIGFVGENDFTRVIFDAEEIYKKFPNASVSMKVQPPKGGIYPATVTRDGNAVIWQVKEADVANRGGGELQLTFTDGETKIKTYIARTDVKRSLAGNGPAPDPVQDWVDNAEEVLDDLAAMDNIAKNAEAGDVGKALSPKTVENGVVIEWQFVEPGAGTDDYADLDNKPSIAGVTLSGNKTLEDLGIAADNDLDNLADEVSDVKSEIAGVKDDLDEKAPAIIINTETAFAHEALKNVENITFIGNSQAFRNAQYANKKNILPDMSGSGTRKDVDWVASGHFLTYSGLCSMSSGTYDVFAIYNSALENPIEAGNYKFIAQIDKGSTTGSENGKWDFYVKYGTSDEWEKVFGEYLGFTDKTYSVTFTGNVTSIRFRASIGKDTNYNGFVAWFGLFESDVVITNTNQSVPSDGTLLYTSDTITDLSVIDTVQHTSTIKYIADTKEYIDEIDVDINNKLPYLTPERFGAIGDGVTDDTTALQDCIDYAIAKNRVVKGFYKYKTTDTLIINTNNGLDIYIKEINCTDDDAAVSISGIGIRFSFHTIISQAKGIKFSNINGACYRHVINGINLDSTNDSIWIGNGCYYTTVTIRRVSSTNGNCITFPTTDPVSNEFVFNDFTCACPAGWVAYYPSDSKFYNFTVEGNCYYGVYDPAGCSFVNWRVTEQCDKYDRYIHGEAGYVGGPLFKFIHASRAARNKYYSNDNIKFFSLNVDDLVTREEYDNVTQWIQENWQGCVFDANAIGSTVGSAMFLLPVGKVMIFGGKRIIIPTYNTIFKVNTASCDLRWLDDETHIGTTGYGNLRLANYLIADVDTEIYLSASYNAIAFKHFELDTDSHDVIVYDWTGTKIFDSTNYTGTKFAFDCIADRENMGRYGSTSSFWSYDGTNHIWEIKELS